MSRVSNWILAVRVLTVAVSRSDSNWTRCSSRRLSIHFGDVTGFKAIAVDLQFPVVVGQVLLRVGDDGFGLQQLHKRVAQGEQQGSFQISLLRGGHGSSLLRHFTAQLTFVAALMEIADSSDLAGVEQGLQGRRED